MKIAAIQLRIMDRCDTQLHPKFQQFDGSWQEWIGSINVDVGGLQLCCK